MYDIISFDCQKPHRVTQMWVGIKIMDYKPSNTGTKSQFDDWNQNWYKFCNFVKPDLCHSDKFYLSRLQKPLCLLS